MKNILLLFLLLGSRLTFAGTAHDESVAGIIQKLKVSKLPKQNDLHFGHKWQCQFFKSKKDQTGVFANLISFEKERDFIQAILWVKNQDSRMPYELNPTNLDFGLMIFGTSGLAGDYSGGLVFNTFTVIRKLNRELLVEQSGRLIDRFANDEYWKPYFEKSPSALFNDANKALAYGRCLPLSVTESMLNTN